MITYRIYSFFKILFFILTSHSLLTRKKTIKFCIIAFSLNTIFIFFNGMYMFQYIHNEKIFKLIMYILSLSYIIYLNLIFKESLSKKIFTFFTIVMFSTITLFIATPIAEFVSRIYGLNCNQNIIYLFRSIINISFVLIAYFWVGSYYKKILNLVSDRIIKYMSLYPAIAFLLLITNFTTPTRVSQLKNFDSIYDMFLFLLFIIIGYILVFVGIYSASQIVSMKYDMEQLDLISKTDPLTGLYNRRYIIGKLENELEDYKKTKNKFSIILADIDHFKYINDTFGHNFGDQVLKSISKNLLATVQDKGIVSRWGGEEFLILLPETNILPAKTLAEDIRQSIQNEIITYNDTPVSVTLTLGVTSNKDFETIDDTIRKSDNALYAGKNNGRNCVVSL